MPNISLYRNNQDKEHYTVSLDYIYERIRTGKKGLKELTQQGRQALLNGDTDTYKALKGTPNGKPGKLLAMTPSGIFKKGTRSVKTLVLHSGIVVTDIDGIDDPVVLVNIIEHFESDPSVVMIFISPSGKGIKILFRIYPIPLNADEHKAAYQTIVEHVDKFRNEPDTPDFKVDTGGSDVSRLCFLAYDKHAYYEEHAVAIQWDREQYLFEIEERKKQQAEIQAKIESGEYSSDFDMRLLDYQDVEDYHDWIRVGMALKNSKIPDGFTIWDTWSQQSVDNYNPNKMQYRWDSFKRDSGPLVTLGTLIYQAQQKDPDFKPLGNNKQRKKLEIAPDTKPQNEVSLETARSELSTAVKQALEPDTSTDTETIQMHLLKGQTGSGKSTMVITTCSTEQKRLLMNAPTKDQADMLYQIAGTAGYDNAMHLKGRANTWHASKIAEIPPKMRTAELFDKSLCIMYDEIERYEDNRIPGRIYCMAKCPHRKECLIQGYLAQFKSIAHADFVSFSNPAALFDLRGFGFLESIVKAKADPEYNELLDKHTEPTKPFELAVLDDYTASGLMSDIELKKSEVIAASQAWTGTPAGDFMKAILEVFTAPNEPADLLQILRKAFDAHIDDRATIDRQLSRHARVGTIVDSKHPVYDDETNELLSDTEVEWNDGIGAPHLVATSELAEPLLKRIKNESGKRAYSVVSLKDMTNREVGSTITVPITLDVALRCGIEPHEITPTWQASASLIRLLDILLNYVENDSNAPVSRKYIVDDEVLTFTIPPQAPVQIFKTLILQSATTDRDEVKRLFCGQPVNFTIHDEQPIQHAKDVKVYQYDAYKITAGGTFDYQIDGKQRVATGLKDAAIKRIEKLNDYAKAVDGLSVFISYKEFTDDKFSGYVDNFDIVRNFDDVAGLNFDGLKLLVIYGTPKVNHLIVMDQARKRYANDTDPLPTGSYDDLTETETFTDEYGTKSIERRYVDPRLDKIRQELSDEKLQQGFGRARHCVWTGTTTLVMTSANIKNITEHAIAISNDEFYAADNPSELEKIQAELNDARDAGDTKRYAEIAKVSERTSRRRTAEDRQQYKAARDAEVIALHKDGLNKSKIADQTGISRGTVNRIIASDQNGQVVKEYLLDVSEMVTPQEQHNSRDPSDDVSNTVDNESQQDDKQLTPDTQSTGQDLSDPIHPDLKYLDFLLDATPEEKARVNYNLSFIDYAGLSHCQNLRENAPHNWIGSQPEKMKRHAQYILDDIRDLL